jgi:hypothetical protein
MANFTKNSIYFLLIILSVTSCVEPDPLTELSAADKDMIITNHDKSANFGNYKTYAIVDSVRVVSKTPADTLKNKSKVNDLILNNVNAELQKDGFVKVSKTQNPDVGINVVIFNYTEQVPVSYFGYTGAFGYYGYPNPGFWGYPSYGYGFPNSYQYYQIQIGSIGIDMIDLKSAHVTSTNQKLNALWAALIVGSVTDSTTVTPDRITFDIQQAFNQSPYLKEGK